VLFHLESAHMLTYAHVDLSNWR